MLAEAAFEVYIAGRLGGWMLSPVGDDAPYDFAFERAGRRVTVQVKLQRSKGGRPMTAREASRRMFPGGDHLFVVETQRTRGGVDRRTGGKTRPYRFDEFDLLAVCMHPSASRWDAFLYAPARWLIPDPHAAGHLFKYQPISPIPDEFWTDDLRVCLERFLVGGSNVMRY